MSWFVPIIFWVLLGGSSAMGQGTMTNVPYEISLRKGSFFTSPLFEFRYTGQYAPPFESALQRYVREAEANGTAERIAIYFEDLQTGKSFGLNENTYFAPASMMKVADMMHVYKLAESQPEILEQKVEIRKRKIATAGDSKLVDGESYSIDRIVTEMIIESDNQAMFALHSHFNNEQLWGAVFRELGQDIDFRADNLKSLSPKSYSTIFKALYRGSYINRSYSEKALKLLAATSFSEGIVAGVDDSTIVVANKFGFREWSDSYQLHETAIVYVNHSPYLLSIMTEGTDPQELRNVLQSVSSIVYRSVNSKSVSASDKNTYSKPRLVVPLTFWHLDSTALSHVRETLIHKTKELLQNDSLEQISIYVMELNSGSFISVNSTERFKPGALMRVPHMMALMKSSEKNPILLEQKFSIKKDTSVFSRIANDQVLVPGKDYTMKQLIERMVIYSDNDALDLIYTSALNKGDVWKELFETLGLSHLWNNNRFTGSISPEEYSKFLSALYYSTSLSVRNSEACVDILCRSKYKLGIRSSIGQDDYAATKFGEMEYQENGIRKFEVHESAIVYAEDNPYVICIMTKGKSFDTQAKVIKTMSFVVYKGLSK